ncbi:MAG: hypothetical protein IAE97_13175 [Chthoniobacterales bacterium]|nr:hypothetical protein [Chthoniobacterales bacterium]
MNKEQAKIIERWEAASGYDATGKDKVRCKKTLRKCLQENQKWLEEHLEDRITKAGSIAAL